MGGGSWSGNRLWWQGTGAQTTAALGGRAEVRERSDQGFHDGLEPRKGHCYNLFLMRNIINIRDQRGIIRPSLFHQRRESSEMTSCADKESCDPSVMGRPTSSLHVPAWLASIFLIVTAAEHLPKSGWKMSSSAGVQQTTTTFPSLWEDRGHPGPWHSLPFPYLSSYPPPHSHPGRWAWPFRARSTRSPVLARSPACHSLSISLIASCPLKVP